jgi:hypothetical protein
MGFLRIFGALLLGLFVALPAWADIRFRNFEDPDEPKWQEGESALPEFPKEESLLEFYVSAGTTNRFFIDGQSISVGNDGVVRFTMVVKTSGGATNTTFEGIRCAAIETRLYAVGRADGTWVKARNSEWKPIENKPINRHHAALSRDYFCPSLIPIRAPEEGRDALRRGKHPDAK